MIYAGVRFAVSGHLAGILIALASLAWPVINVLIFTFGARHCRQEGRHLRSVVRDVLTRRTSTTA
jgi:hypothetical protein